MHGIYSRRLFHIDAINFWCWKSWIVLINVLYGQFYNFSSHSAINPKSKSKSNPISGNDVCAIFYSISSHIYIAINFVNHKIWQFVWLALPMPHTRVSKGDFFPCANCISECWKCSLIVCLLFHTHGLMDLSEQAKTSYTFTDGKCKKGKTLKYGCSSGTGRLNHVDTVETHKE